jgi:hypothetical protein
MDRYNEALRIARLLVTSEHLGPKSDIATDKTDKSGRIYKNLQIALGDINQSLLLDSANLTKMNRLAVIAISGSLILLFICLLLVVINLTRLGLVSGIFSLVFSVLSRLVFRREDIIRRSATSQLMNFSSLYSMVVLFQFCQAIDDQGVRDKTISKLVTDFSTPPN